MALAAFFSSFVSFVFLLEYSSIYIYGIEILSEYMSTNFTLCSCYTEYTASLSGRCFSAVAYAITLCHDDDIRVVSGSLDVVSRLRDTIIWGYILRMRGGPLMVTAQYGYSSVLSPGWMVLTGCRKELGSQGWLLEVPGGHWIEGIS